MLQTVDLLARALYERQARSYTEDQEQIDYYWLEVRDYWMDEAQFVLNFLAGIEKEKA